MLEEILRIDTELFIYLNNLGTSSFDVFWSFLSRKEANITSDTEICHLFSIANFRAVRPKVSEINVNKLGIKLLKDNCFMLFLR